MNQILQFVRVSMYMIAGLAIMILPIPLFKNVGTGFKIGLGVIFILYSGFRIYQLIQRKKTESKNED